MFSQMENEWFDQEVPAEVVTRAQMSRRAARKTSALIRSAFVALLLAAVAIILLGSRAA